MFIGDVFDIFPKKLEITDGRLRYIINSIKEEKYYNLLDAGFLITNFIFKLSNLIALIVVAPGA